ncbi:MAG: haloacid dehalogenase-like hydrolase [Methyloligellaceae bacterium]
MHETIAVIFDFDDTLAPDSTSGFLSRCGIDVPSFWNDEVRPLLEDDWDPIPAYLYKMVEWSNSGRIEPITRQALLEWGEEIDLHPGVETIFDRMRHAVKATNPRVSIEFYLISSGIGEVLRHTSVAHEFTDIWASDFVYDGKGRICFPRKVVSFTDKTRYVFHIQKGIVGPEFRGKPFAVNQKVDATGIRVPLDHMIMVGDGYTDIPCFSLIKKAAGYAIGVYDQADREKWGRAWGFIEEGRVSNLLPADFRESSALSDILLMAVKHKARSISLATRTYRG